MRTPMVAGNWKLNGTRASAVSLAADIVKGVQGDQVEVLVCPVYVHIPEVQTALQGSAVKLGAQDAASQGEGAYTGEVSAAMLAEFGCDYVILGHSERRSLFGDADDVVAQKFLAVQKAGLVPVLCVGESLDERESGVTEEVVGRQLDAVIEQAGIAALDNCVVAYEPVWAIGTGKTATPEQAQDVHAFIRNKVAGLDVGVAAKLRILYGGSVKPDNARELFGMADIDGGLIGGAALKAGDFLVICDAAKP
ncbi:MAG: triose-phosphate isomerase, partial [Gammaproteobacteria bacterium]|nr:triose-phosphate isomerase [Gammaproteobacteria bacterium]